MKKPTVLLAALFLSAIFATAQAGPWFVPGSYYDGGTGIWSFNAGNEMFDDGDGPDAVAVDGIFTALVTSDQAGGRHECKVALSDWSISHPNSNQWLHTSGAGDAVLFTLDTNAHGDGWIPNENIVCNDHALLPGWIPEVIGSADEIGGMAWAFGVPATWNGAFWVVQVTIATPGLYEYKWRANGNWADFAFGADGMASAGANLTFETFDPGVTLFFELDPATCRGRVGTEGSVGIELTSWSQVKSFYR